MQSKVSCRELSKINTHEVDQDKEACEEHIGNDRAFL